MPGEREEAREGRPLGWPALILAVAGLLLAWIPFVGAGLACLASILAIASRRRRRVALAAVIAIPALVLGGLFTALQLRYAPPPLDPAEVEAWEDFDRLFQAGGGQGGEEPP